MKRIKKFESFTNHRFPEEITYEEWIEKKYKYAKEIFSQKEKDFFKNLAEENIQHINVYGDNKSEIVINWTKDRGEILIIKLTDCWYLISNIYAFDFEDDEYFICDDWEEVLGYLSSINLI